MANYATPSQPNPWIEYLQRMQRTDPTIEQALNRDPMLAWKAYLGVVGQNQSRAFQNWLASQWDLVTNQLAALPHTQPTEYLKYFDPWSLYIMSSPRQRGDLPNLFAPTMRMMR